MLLPAYQAAVARMTMLLFLKGVSMGSPNMRLARRLQPKMTTIDDSQQLNGCFRENAKPP